MSISSRFELILSIQLNHRRFVLFEIEFILMLFSSSRNLIALPNYFAVWTRNICIWLGWWDVIISGTGVRRIFPIHLLIFRGINGKGHVVWIYRHFFFIHFQFSIVHLLVVDFSRRIRMEFEAEIRRFWSHLVREILIPSIMMLIRVYIMADERYRFKSSFNVYILAMDVAQ